MRFEFLIKKKCYRIFLNILISFCIFNFSLALRLTSKTMYSAPILDEQHVIRLEFDVPEKPGDKETLGVTSVIEILDHTQNKFIPYRFLIDSLSSVFWIISSQCESDICNDHRKYTPVNKLLGEASIELNTGKIEGNMYFTTVNLKNFILQHQSVLLVNSITVYDFENSKIDGVLGISKFLSILHNKTTYKSVLQNIQNQNLPQYFILKLGGNDPYLKFGPMNSSDWQYFKVDKTEPIYTERIEWINLIEKGKLVLPLRHIMLIYRDKNNEITKREWALTHCVHHGCRATIDTKAYFIYGPEFQLQHILKLKTPVCSIKNFEDLPDIEFSFYDINETFDDKTNISHLTVDLTLEPEDYMISLNENSIDDGSQKDNCVPGFGDHGTEYGWNLGILFLKKFVLMYDFKNDRLGFVRSNNDY